MSEIYVSTDVEVNDPIPGPHSNFRISTKLPDTICFRVSRCCNACCAFCLAPANGLAPDGDTLVHRIDWLMSRGVTAFQFCGGEPSIHPDLPRLLIHVRARGGKVAVTTNGIEMSAELVSALRASGARVKVSLHGDREYHDQIVGRRAFDSTTGNLRTLLASGVAASVQSTVVAGGEWAVDWLIDFCIHMGVRRLSVLPFLPRGDGRALRDRYELTTIQRVRLHNHVTTRRRALNGRLDLRWLDLSSRPMHVADADGSIVLEGASPSRDRFICRIPVPASTRENGEK
jgi:molybdenum cofactor biosynthesis enzyme MoaA